MQYEIGYTFSDFHILPDSLMISAKSALSFLPREKITAFYTPPYSDTVYTKLRNLIQIKKVDWLTPSFATFQNSIKYHNGEKIHVSAISSKNVLLMDCDTLITHNPIEIFDDDFDLAVMELTNAQKTYENNNIWSSRWEKFFEEHNKKVRRYIPTSIVFGKDNIFKEIRDEFIRLMHENLMHIEIEKMKSSVAEMKRLFYPKEEYALSLCMSDKKVKYLPRNILGAFEERVLPFHTRIGDWRKEETPLIWHIGGRGIQIRFTEV